MLVYYYKKRWIYIIGDIDWDIIVIVNHDIRDYLIKIGEK
jgi:hypothetical protein